MECQSHPSPTGRTAIPHPSHILAQISDSCCCSRGLILLCSGAAELASDEEEPSLPSSRDQDDADYNEAEELDLHRRGRLRTVGKRVRGGGAAPAAAGRDRGTGAIGDPPGSGTMRASHGQHSSACTGTDETRYKSSGRLVPGFFPGECASGCCRAPQGRCWARQGSPWRSWSDPTQSSGCGSARLTAGAGAGPGCLGPRR